MRVSELPFARNWIPSDDARSRRDFRLFVARRRRGSYSRFVLKYASLLIQRLDATTERNFLPRINPAACSIFVALGDPYRASAFRPGVAEAVVLLPTALTSWFCLLNSASPECFLDRAESRSKPAESITVAPVYPCQLPSYPRTASSAAF